MEWLQRCVNFDSWHSFIPTAGKTASQIILSGNVPYSGYLISDMIKLKHIQGLSFIGKYIKFNTDGPMFCSHLLLKKIGGCIKFSSASSSEKKHFYLMWEDYLKNANYSNKFFLDSLIHSAVHPGDYWTLQNRIFNLMRAFQSRRSMSMHNFL